MASLGYSGSLGANLLLCLFPRAAAYRVDSPAPAHVCVWPLLNALPMLFHSRNKCSPNMGSERSFEMVSWCIPQQHPTWLCDWPCSFEQKQCQSAGEHIEQPWRTTQDPSSGNYMPEPTHTSMGRPGRALCQVQSYCWSGGWELNIQYMDLK